VHRNGRTASLVSPDWVGDGRAAEGKGLFPANLAMGVASPGGFFHTPQDKKDRAGLIAQGKRIVKSVCHDLGLAPWRLSAVPGIHAQ
jgi:hypothetical protein